MPAQRGSHPLKCAVSTLLCRASSDNPAKSSEFPSPTNRYWLLITLLHHAKSRAPHLPSARRCSEKNSFKLDRSLETHASGILLRAASQIQLRPDEAAAARPKLVEKNSGFCQSEVRKISKAERAKWSGKSRGLSSRAIQISVNRVSPRLISRTRLDRGKATPPAESAALCLHKPCAALALESNSHPRPRPRTPKTLHQDNPLTRTLSKGGASK
jgi:hypothetical protein